MSSHTVISGTSCLKNVYMCNVNLGSLNIVYSIICIFEGLREGYNFVLHLYTVK